MAGIPRAHLLALPSELLIQEVLSSVPPPSFVACSQTCKTLHRLISSSLLLTYLKELFVAGMIDNSRCTYNKIPLTRRLDMLRERERRWLQLEPQWRRNFELSRPQGKQQSFDIVPGYLIFGVAKPNAGDAVRCLRLPIKWAEELVWNETAGVGQDIFNVAMALEEHNLIACLALYRSDTGMPSDVKVHLIDHSTGEYLPLPAGRIREVDSSGLRLADEIWGGIAVCGENLVVSVNYARETGITEDGSDIPLVNRMEFWNWQYGVGKGALSIEHVKTEDLAVNRLTFLREDILLTPNSEETALDLYHIPPLPRHGGPVEIIRLVARFKFPELATTFPRCSMESHLSPCHSSSTTGIPPNHSAEKPFINDPGRSVLSVTIELDNDVELNTLFFIVRWQCLLKYALEVVEELAERSPHTLWHKVYAWDEWGPQNCRLFSVPGFRHFSTTTGSRWVSLTTVPDDEETSSDLPFKIEVYDFDETRMKVASQRAVTRGSARMLEFPENPDPNLHIELVDASSPNIYPASEGVFAQEIRTYLPYIRTSYAQGSSEAEDTRFDYLFPPCNWDGILVDDQRIIGVHVDSDDDEDIREIEILYLG